MRASQKNPPQSVEEKHRAIVDSLNRQSLKKRGRPLRVLHIGNIANNGYNNAKLLNEAGIHSDVLCYDYYHVMGCPEWEDADFKGNIVNDFFPNWNQVDLNGFERPRWFIQGPLWLCMRYLHARCRQENIAETVLWKLNAVMRANVSAVKRAFNSTTDFIIRAAAYLKRSILFTSYWPLVLIPAMTIVLLAAAVLILISVLSLFFYLLIGFFRAFKMAVAAFRLRQAGHFSGNMPDFKERVRDLIHAYDRYFPNRRDKLTPQDFNGYRHLFAEWAKLIQHYDLVEGYATDPIIPMLVGTRPYIAYEHGTIREIPFQPNATGRLSALSYRLADHVIITNPDCSTAAGNLKLSKCSYIPHVLDKKYHIETGLNDSKSAFEIDSPYILCPARHDWDIKGTPYAIRGFARFSAEHPEFRLVMSKWGVDLSKSKRLIHQLGLDDKVIMIDPLNIHNLIRATRSAFALLDQFVLFFGGIAPTALVLGTPLIAHIDFEQCSWCFDEKPPYFEARDEAGIYHALDEILKLNRADYEAKARSWVIHNYNYHSVTARHLMIYQNLLDQTADAPASPVSEAVSL